MSTKESSATAKPRKRVLKHRHYAAQTGIRWLFQDSGTAIKDEQVVMRRRLNQLAAEAGIETPPDLEPGELYVTAIRALIDQGKDEHSELVVMIQDAGAKFKMDTLNKNRTNREEAALQEAIKKNSPPCPKCSAEPKRQTFTLNKSWNGEGKLFSGV